MKIRIPEDGITNRINELITKGYQWPEDCDHNQISDMIRIDMIWEYRFE